MPAYEIRYLDDKGRVVHHFNANCESDIKAKVTAHAMKSPNDSGLEVWLSGALIYRRARCRSGCGGQSGAGLWPAAGLRSSARLWPAPRLRTASGL
jgi:hypothetical protein